jgi:epoxyqueuosine reductase
MGDQKNKLDRRQFLKVGSAGTVLAGLAAAGVAKQALAETAAKEMTKAVVSEHDDFPVPMRDDYKPMPHYENIFGPAIAGRYLKAVGKRVPEDVMATGDSFLKKWNYHFDPDKPGHDQLSKAVCGGAWALINKVAGPSGAAISDYGLLRWTQPEDKPPSSFADHNFVQKEKYRFKSKEDASAAIKRAARLYGADLVGITRRDTRWDYSEFFNPVPPMGREMFPPPPTPESIPKIMAMMQKWGPKDWFFGWEKFPFKPKTVIVVGFEMDYEGISASPSEVSSAAVADRYSVMVKVAYQLSVFLKQLGYNAVPCGNDTALSIPYAVSAGLGETGRHGLLINYKYGPRIRLAKVYTNLDLVEYDKPKTFGVKDFCRNCKRCADSCPSKAISFDTDPSFEPTHDDKDPFYNNKGALKWYVNCRKCFQFWEKNGADCSNCIASCPYNKPDFWHHRIVRKMGKIEIDVLHAFLREMDIVFGYGNTFDVKAVERFFENRSDRDYDGGLS